ncbi:hypothetical protein BH11VER1_BH11VER1_15380 [soil metagenome]
MLKRVRILRWLAAIFCLCLIAFAITAWWASSEIIHPPRRSLQDYHLEMLGNPAKFGLIIRPFEVHDAISGAKPTPCLLCEPDLRETGARGAKLREQLIARGLSLPEHGKIIGTLVLLHGRKGRKEDGLPIAERFCAAGFRCLLPDLPAHGDNENEIASYGLNEWNLPNAVMQEATKQFGIPASPRALWGISQGGSVAVHAAAKTPWDTLIVVSSFADFDELCLAQSRRLFGPFSGMLHAAVQALVEKRAGYRADQICPIAYVRRLEIPTLIAHGTDDALIPVSSGKALFEALPGTDKQWIIVEGGTHDHVLTTPMPLYAEMTAFYLSHLPKSH